MVGMKTSLNLVSTPDSLTVVEKKIDEVTKEANVNEGIYGNVLIAVTEGVNNAIHHGNKSNPEKNIDIDIEINTDNQLVFMIKDQGDGFDPEALPDPTDPANIEKPHGRGVFLMQQLSDEIEFEDEGRTVIIKFTLQ
ncbi:ATP-binding protein [Flavobacteriales bacterium]|nr:ATP-binding protein [Flavobacteriales bacterium]